jgi:hypothetical protein
MLRLHRHVVVGDRHLDVVDHLLVLRLHLIYMEMLVHQLKELQYVEENQHLLVDVPLVDVQQILDELNLDVAQTFQVVVVHRLDVVVLRLDVVVDVVLCHQLKMDYYLDVEGVELLHQLKMDYYLDVVQVLEVQIFLQRQLLLHASLQILPLLLQLVLAGP